MSPRGLAPNADGTAKSPFLYDPHALGSLRPDQVPRFFAALTDRDKLPLQSVELGDLVATQDRVDPVKVGAIASLPDRPGDPVVVRHQGRNYIADGHHRLSADWLAGENSALVRFKDLEPVSQALKGATIGKRFEMRAKVEKVSDELGLVFGWAIVCKVDGKDYYDLNRNQETGEAEPDHIPEDVMLKAAADFMEGDAIAKEMHSGEARGTYTFMFPLTGEIAKAMGITTKKTGLMVAVKPDPDMLAKFKSGELSGFSIGGYLVDHERVE